MLTQVRQRKWRSGFFFASGLCLAAAISVGAEGLSQFKTSPENRILKTVDEHSIALANHSALTDKDLEAARVAWSYIASNTVQETGLVNSVSGIRSTTLWDQGSYLFGLISARKIGIIPQGDFDQRVAAFLTSLAKLPLFEGTLPNKVYRTDTLEMTDYSNQLVAEGIGWSALDMARLLLALAALEQAQPTARTQIRDVLSLWRLTALAHNGELIGTTRKDGVTQALQEGRIGYEQYAARAAALWGLDVSQALSANRIVEWRQIEGVQVAIDLRKAERFGAITPVLGEPYFLQALELGLDSESRHLATQIFLAQRARYHNQGILTAVSEDHIDQSPYFLYASVHSNGEDWAVVSEAGQTYPQLRTLSSKAAFAWDALFGSDYTRLLRDRINSLPMSDQGWPAGIYETDGRTNAVYTLNTNAVILQALHYRAYGPLWRLP